MIDEKKLIEEMEMHCNNINPSSHLYLVKGAWDDCIKIIKSQPKVGEWIPCSERLPEENGSYLVSGKWGSGKVVVSDCDYSTSDGYFRTAWNFDVEAWMPLPEAYKGDK